MSEENFPIDVIGYGFIAGIEHSTTIIRTQSGREFVNQNWSTGLNRYVVPLEAMSDAERTTILDFVDQMKGAADTFHFTDPVSASTVRCRFATDRSEIETRFFETHFWPNIEIRQVRE